MEIRIAPEEVLAEMQNQYPNETLICIQAVQIKKMGELLDEATPEDEEPKFEVVQDAEV